MPTTAAVPVLLLAGPGVLPGEAELVRLAAAHGHEVAWLRAGSVPPPRVLDRVEFFIPPLPYLLDDAAWSVFERLPRLRVLQLLSTGTDWIAHLDVRGAAVATSAGVSDASVAELALGLMIAAQRDLIPHTVSLAQGGWDQDAPSPGLRGRRLLLVGQGGIGREIERHLAPFGVSCTRVARTRRELPSGPVHAQADLPDLLPSAEILVVAVPLTAETAGFLDARLLGLLPDGALVVNVGRGRLIDTPALVAEVSAGRLRAALDVVDPDPLPAEHPLRRLPGAIVLPHVGRNTPQVAERQAALLTAQLRRHLAGEPLANLL